MSELFPLNSLLRSPFHRRDDVPRHRRDLYARVKDSVGKLRDDGTWIAVCRYEIEKFGNARGLVARRVVKVLRSCAPVLGNSINPAASAGESRLAICPPSSPDRPLIVSALAAARSTGAIYISLARYIARPDTSRRRRRACISRDKFTTSLYAYARV